MRDPYCHLATKGSINFVYIMVANLSCSRRIVSWNLIKYLLDNFYLKCLVDNQIAKMAEWHLSVKCIDLNGALSKTSARDESKLCFASPPHSMDSESVQH